MTILNAKVRTVFLSVAMVIALKLSTNAQSASKADSLRQALSISKEDTNRVNLLCEIASDIYYEDRRKSFEYALQAEQLASKLNWKKGEAIALLLEYIYYSHLGDYSIATKKCYRAIKLAEEINDTLILAMACYRMGETYRSLKNKELNLFYAKRALMLAKKINDKFLIIDVLSSLAVSSTEYNQWDEFEKYYSELLPIAQRLKETSVLANLLAMRGDRAYTLKNYREAVDFFKQALGIYVAQEQGVFVAFMQSVIGGTYALLGMKDSALYFANAALKMSEEQHYVKERMDAYKALYEVNNAFDNYEKALHYYLIYDSLKSSLYSREKTEEIARTRLNYEQDKKDVLARAEQDKKDVVERTIRNSIAAGFTGSLLFLLVVVLQRNKIAREKKRSEELLLNILPAETAEELKRTGTTRAKDFDEVTVLFTDFKNFTLMSERLTAQELVNEINYCYSAFDKIIGRHGIEKIKTIGDSYMCAGGLPVANRTNASDIVKGALEIRDFMLAEKQAREAAGKPFFEIRIGCNTGAVVAGIVGIKKYSYDIWGDAVNIASRMEQNSEAGKVNISGSTYELVKDKFTCTHRGKIQAKNKGEIDMYFVEAIT